MQDSSTALSTSPAKPLPFPPKTTSRLQVRGKLAVALRTIIHEGQDIAPAAERAGMTGHAVRCALAKPHVIAWMKQEREVFRAYVSAQNIHRAKEMRDTSGNAMAQLGAMKLIEQIGDEQMRSPASQQRAGMVVVVVNAGQSTAAASPAAVTIDHEPNGNALDQSVTE